MNPVTQFLVDNLIAVFFFYGLAFFTLGIMLGLASHQPSELRFVQAIRPLSLFGLLHAAHEWLEMFQLIRLETEGVLPSPGEEWLRLGLLVLSFAMLLDFACILLLGVAECEWLRGPIVGGLPLVWAIAVSAIAFRLGWLTTDSISSADVLARYLVGIPGALLGSWALMVQQRTFRQVGMPQFGQDLVWCASALFLYGAIGQVFVRQSPLPPSQLLNGPLFLAWFGIPVQVFRATMAAVLTFFMMRALRAFALESQQRLEAAVQTQLDAQEHALAVERQSLQETERLNEELRTRAAELALLLDLSNLLAAHAESTLRLEQALGQVVNNLPFADAGMILLAPQPGTPATLAAVTGFATHERKTPGARFGPAWDLGLECMATGRALCVHKDGIQIGFDLDEALVGRECWQYPSPTELIALPLSSQSEVTGAIVLARAKGAIESLSLADLKLLAGISQQMGLSIENARLYQEAQAREQMLGDLLYQVVGAQEAERQRIARDLHDATGQSLSAIALGLRGLENALAEQGVPSSRQLVTLQGFTNEALTELRRIISDLRPPQLDDLGLVPAVQWYVRSFEQRNPAIKAKLCVEGDLPRLHAEYETLLYRIIQESLTNIAKHAGADEVEIGLTTTADELIVQIEDNGRGFDVEATLGSRIGGWGLAGIRERTQLLGGEAQIRSVPGEGTRVSVRVPLTHAVLRAKV